MNSFVRAATFQFNREVRLEGSASPGEFLASIAELMTPRLSFSLVGMKNPLRGRLSGEGGVVRWPLVGYRFVPPRSLHFTVCQTTNGTLLTGQFKLWTAFRVIVMTWLGVGILFQLEQIIVPGMIYRQGWPVIGKGLLSILGGLCMAYGYTWGCIRLGRPREGDLEAVLRNVLAGPIQAVVVRDLLSSR